MPISGISTEEKRACSVVWGKSITHRFHEDSFRILSRDISAVEKRGDGELFGIFDGIGSAPEERRAAHELSEGLLAFLRKVPENNSPDADIHKLLLEALADENLSAPSILYVVLLPR